MNNQVIIDLLESKMKEQPDMVAVRDEDRSLTRVELGGLIDTIACQIPPEVEKVGIVMDHSVEMIAAIFAVLKCGAAYVPAEPSLPTERICFMMKDSAVDCIILNGTYADKLAEFSAIEVNPGMEIAHCHAETKAEPDSLAYILYTSGSTGKPKGVSVLNRNVCHYVRAFQHEFHPTEKDVVLQYSVCSFDIFVEEVFTTLLSGASLALPSAKTKEKLSLVMDFVEKNHVTIISGFPYLLLDMNRMESIPKSLRLLISGGDVLRASYITNLVKKVDVYNTYGPSETTVCASYFRCNDVLPLEDGTYPIGTAVLGSEMVILDGEMKPVQPGTPGEICILGGSVSAGYFGDRKKENKAFVTLENGERLYRSGDLGYLLPDGNIAFMRRQDTQVMILGKRVEPVEVEGILCNCEEVEKAVVKPYSDEHNLSYLVAYVVPKNREFSLSALKTKLSQFLTPYMIPEFFVRMNDLPLNANGKVDSAALPIIMKEGFVA
nr:amino acid adenylation domain-containing protein [uncultured Clostridium sp.]